MAKEVLWFKLDFIILFCADKLSKIFFVVLIHLHESTKKGKISESIDFSNSILKFKFFVGINE